MAGFEKWRSFPNKKTTYKICLCRAYRLDGSLPVLIRWRDKTWLIHAAIDNGSRLDHNSFAQTCAHHGNRVNFSGCLQLAGVADHYRLTHACHQWWCTHPVFINQSEWVSGWPTVSALSVPEPLGKEPTWPFLHSGLLKTISSQPMQREPRFKSFMTCMFSIFVAPDLRKWRSLSCSVGFG